MPSARHRVCALILFEAVLLALIGVFVGTVFAYGLVSIFAARLQGLYGISLQAHRLTPIDLAILGAVLTTALVLGLLPAWRAYRNTLNDGLQVRL